MKVKHLIVRSRNTTCAPLREIVVPHPTILRMGSTTPTEKITKCEDPIEINPAAACAKSSDKRIMKACFIDEEIPTAEYICLMAANKEDAMKILGEKLTEWGRIICKHYASSKGKGIYLLDNLKSLEEWVSAHEANLEKYVFERYYTYSREYRIHVTKDGCFYTCRKLLKRDAEVRWHRHNENCVWVTEGHELFDKPTNWDEIVASCVKALAALGLDIAAFDVKVQNNKHENPKYIILESNSAPSLGPLGLEKYVEVLTKIVNNG